MFELKNKTVETVVLVAAIVFVVVCAYAVYNMIDGYVKSNDTGIGTTAKPYKSVAAQIVENDTVQDEQVAHQENFVMYSAPATEGFKSYMDYRTITDETSLQYKLQNEYAYTDKESGIRMVGDRYCIALGSYFTTEIGQYVDLILGNSTIIPCILADQKDDAHTDDMNAVTIESDCVSEFIVDSNVLPNMVRLYGDVSRYDESWEARVTQVQVYDKNIFDEQ